MPSQALLTPQEAAERLQCSPRTLETWRNNGYGPAHIRLNAGKRAMIRYRPEDVDAFIAGRVAGSSEQGDALASRS